MRAIAAVSLTAALSLFAETPPAPATTRVVSLEDCIKLALEHNLDIQISRYNPQIARFNLQGSYGAYEPTLALYGEHGESTSPQGFDPRVGTYPGTSGENNAVGASLGGLLPWGTTYSFGAGLNDSFGNSSRVTDLVTTNAGGNLVTNSITFAQPYENTSGRMGALSLRQPLLRDFWTDGARLNISIRKNDLKNSELGLQFQVMTSVTDVEVAYDNLISAFDQVKVQEKAVELAEKLLSDNKKRVEVGSLAPLDEKQAEAQVASSRADLLVATRNLAVAQNNLKGLLTDDYSRLYPMQLQPATKLLAVPVHVDVQASWIKALAQRPDILQARINVDNIDATLVQNKNQIFPSLDLLGTIGYNSSGKEFSDALQQWGQQDAPFSSIRVEFSMPIGNRAAKNSYRATKAQKEQTLLGIKRLEQGVLAGIDNAATLVRTSLEAVNATREARVYSEAALDAEVKKLENGKSTSFQVLQLQKDLTTARSEEIRALAAYNIALAQLSFAEASTLERHNLSIAVQ